MPVTESCIVLPYCSRTPANVICGLLKQIPHLTQSNTCSRFSYMSTYSNRSRVVSQRPVWVTVCKEKMSVRETMGVWAKRLKYWTWSVQIGLFLSACYDGPVGGWYLLVFVFLHKAKSTQGLHLCFRPLCYVLGNFLSEPNGTVFTPAIWNVNQGNECPVLMISGLFLVDCSSPKRLPAIILFCCSCLPSKCPY